MRTVKDNLILEPLEQTETGGLIIPNTDNIIRGKVIVRGPDLYNSVDNPDIELGETVLVHKNAVTEIEVEGKKYFVTTEEKILVILEA